MIRRAVVSKIRLALCATSLLLGYGCASVDEEWFVAPQADLQEESRHHDLSLAFGTKGVARLGYEGQEFVVTGHRIKSGDDFILAFRRFDRGSSWLVDQATFTKLTASIPQAFFKPGGEIHFPGSSNAIAYYSASSSNFPGAGGCFGYASRGLIKVLSVAESEATVQLNLTFSLSSPVGSPKECGEQNIQGLFTVPIIQVARLTPWQGVAGKAIYEETIKQ